MASIRLLKKELRQRARRSLAELASDSIVRQTSRATQILFSLPQYQAAKRVSVFLSMPAGELSTLSIVDDAFAQGKRVYVPYTYSVPSSTSGEKPRSIMDMVELHSRQDLDTLQADKWGIPTPSEDSLSRRLNCFGGRGKSEAKTNVDVEVHTDANQNDTAGLDLIIMPGMVFDRNMGRLGHGKGFYDSFLDRYQQHIQIKNQPTRESSSMPFLVGLALDEQILPADELVPMDTTDWRLDAIITGSGGIIRP